MSTAATTYTAEYGQGTAWSHPSPPPPCPRHSSPLPFAQGPAVRRAGRTAELAAVTNQSCGRPTGGDVVEGGEGGSERGVGSQGGGGVNPPLLLRRTAV